MHATACLHLKFILILRENLCRLYEVSFEYLVVEQMQACVSQSQLSEQCNLGDSQCQSRDERWNVNDKIGRDSEKKNAWRVWNSKTLYGTSISIWRHFKEHLSFHFKQAMKIHWCDTTFNLPEPLLNIRVHRWKGQHHFTFFQKAHFGKWTIYIWPLLDLC